MIKILACLFMLIDHVGFIIFPDEIVYRVIGRLAYPLFAYQIALSIRKTSNSNKYLYRMIIWALISQIPYNLAFQTNLLKEIIFNKAYVNILSLHLNVMFTFSIAISLIIVYRKYSKVLSTPITRLVSIIIIPIVLLFAQLIDCDYGAYGVAMVIMFYFLKDNLKYAGVFLGILTIIYTLIKMYIYSETYIIQIFCMFSIYFFDIKFKRLRLNKYFFYAFYPIHIIIIFLVNQYIIM